MKSEGTVQVIKETFLFQVLFADQEIAGWEQGFAVS